MRTTLSAALLCAFLAPAILGAASPSPPPIVMPGVKSKATAPPEIYHVSVRPLCSALRAKIAPSIGMILQNDKMIGKSPDLFKQYSLARFNQATGGQQMTVYKMQNLVLPLADNILAIQKLLDDPAVFPPAARDEQDRRKIALKNQVLQSLAQQQAALDIINGFVQTQQLADMQHEGMGYIREMIGNDQQLKQGQPDPLANIAPAEDPQHRPQAFDDTVIAAGLPPNPYEVDLTRVPGLILGFNPISALQQGVQYTQEQGKTAENTLAQSVNETVKICNSGQAPAPAPTP